MNISYKQVIGGITISVAFILFAFSFAPVASAQSNNSSLIAELRAQLAELEKQLYSLSGGSSTRGTTAVSTAGGNAACPYIWARNLTIGSTGDDVRQLQRFLNGNPQTQVATSGVGSPGNETSYFGPATASAASRFQELYAAQILTPLGLTRGTGGFFTSTRKHANNVCQSGSSSTRGVTSPTVSSQPSANIVVRGDELVITPGNNPSDSYAVQGAQRVPYTSFVLTAGNDNVRISGVRVKRFGLSSDDNFDSVALVDSNGVQIGTSRSLNSKHEALLGGNLVIPRNRSVTLTVVGNVTNNTSSLTSGSIAGLEVVDIISDTRVRGVFPLGGAAHVFSEGVTLQTATVTVSGGGEDIDFDEDTEVVSVDIDLGGSNVDEEDAYLRSITFEQTGSADNDELGDLTLYVDDKRVSYTLVQDGDRQVFNFRNNGVLIEENKDIEVTLEVNTNRGYNETVNFKIDDVSDIYIVGAEYGYGLPVAFHSSNTSAEASDSTIKSGSVRSGGGFKFEDEVQYGDNRVIGAELIEFEGEDIDFEDLTFSVSLSGFDYTNASTNSWESAEVSEVSLDNVRLRIGDRVVAYADDGNIEFSEPSSSAAQSRTVRFNDTFTVDVSSNDEEILFEIVADLDNDWAHFDGAEIEFKLTNVDKAEGVRSERDYTKTGEYFANDITFENVDLVGNVVEFEITDRDVRDTNYVAGSNSVVFGTLEVDASETIDELELKDLYLTFTASTSVSGNKVSLTNLDDCIIEDQSGDRVASTSNNLSGTSVAATSSVTATISDQVRFDFDNGTEVGAGGDANFTIICDIDNGASTGDSYKIAATTSDKVKYTLNSDDQEVALTTSDNSDSIAVTATGTVRVQTDNPDSNESLVAVSVVDGADGIGVLQFTVEAEREDIEIRSIYLTGVSLGAGTNANGDSISISETEINNFISGFRISKGNSSVKTAKPGNYGSHNTAEGSLAASTVTAIKFSSVNETVEANEREEFVLSIDYKNSSNNNTVAKTRSGQWLEATGLIVVWKGETSNDYGRTTVSFTSDFTKNRVFNSIPSITSSQRNSNLSNGDKELYEFSVSADNDGDIYVNQFAFDFTISGSSTLSSVTVKRGNVTVGTNSTGVSSSTSNYKVELTNPENIRNGETIRYTVEAQISGTTDNDSVTIELSTPSSTEPTRLGQAYSASIGNFVWSPNSLDLYDDETSSNKDWFNGYSIFDNDDVESWTLAN